MAGWSARALARLLGIPAPTVSAWVNTGLVTPEQFGRGRTGHTIGIAGLMELLAVIELRQAGFSLRAIRRAVENLHELTGLQRPLAKLIIVVRGKDIVWVDDDSIYERPISAFQNPGQRLMIFPIGEKHEACLQKLALGSAPKTEVAGVNLGGRTNAT